MTLQSNNQDDAITFQLRNDLQFADYPIGFERQLVVKDPLKLEYFLFEPFEEKLLGLLKRPTTEQDLHHAANRILNPAVVATDEIKKFLHRLLDDNLVMVNKPGMGHALWQSSVRRKSNEWLQTFLGVLAIRFRGINPQGVLDVVNPLTRWLFHPVLVVFAAFVFSIALVAALMNANRIFATDYLWQNLNDPRTLVAMGLALMVVKILHELGHALACRSIGRDCHELGVMLLAFVPCLYCNVSDVWMEPTRWKRIMVSAAGIYVEMCIAAVCVPLWLFSYDGPVQVFWFAMLTICSVNTLLVNGNPLLRYDGYYVLSDLIGVPNLYSVAQKTISERLQHFFFRNVKQPLPISWLDLYGMGCRFYRVFVVTLIIFAIYTFFERLELPSLGTLVAVLLAAMTFGVSVVGNVRKLANVRWKKHVRAARSLLFLLVMIAIIGFAVCLPVETKTYSDGETELRGNCLVYSPDNGKITWHVKSGQSVSENAILSEVENSALEFKLLVQRQLLGELKLSLKNLELLQSQGADNSREIELQKNAFKNARSIAEQLERQKKELVIVAPASGRLVPLPQTNVGKKRNSLDLNRNSSTLLDENVSANVQSGEPVAVVFNEDSQLVRLNVPEQKMNHVEVGQKVKLLIGQHSPEIIFGQVAAIAIDNMYSLEDSAEPQTTLQDEIVVLVEFDQPVSNFFYRSKVKAAIIGDRIPFYEFAWRLVADNLSF